MKSVRYQFGIRELIALTTASAVVAAICARIDAPQFAQGLVAAYFVVLVGWIVMRGPFVYANLVEARKQRQKLEERRRELERRVVELRQPRRIDDSVDES